MGVTFTGMYEFPTKKFYWALSTDFKFSEMPDLNDQHNAFIDSASTLFQGNPRLKLVSVNKEGEGKKGEFILLRGRRRGWCRG